MTVSRALEKPGFQFATLRAFGPFGCGTDPGIREKPPNLPQSRTRPAPKHLSAQAKRLWRGLVEEYGVADGAGLAILTAGLEAHDRMRQAQQAIDKDGATFRDRFGQLQMNPAVRIERDSRVAWLGALKAMNFDLEPLGHVGRPNGPPQLHGRR